MVNKITLIGRAGQDCEFKNLEMGATVARFSLATSERWQDKNGEWQEHTDWHNVVCWRDLADRAQQRVRKGLLLYVEGKVSYRKYTDRDGNERTATDIVAATFRALEKTDGDREARSFPAEPPAERGRAGASVGTPADPQFTGGNHAAAAAPAVSGADDLPF